MIILPMSGEKPTIKGVEKKLSSSYAKEMLEELRKNKPDVAAKVEAKVEQLRLREENGSYVYFSRTRDDIEYSKTTGWPELRDQYRMDDLKYPPYRPEGWRADPIPLVDLSSRAPGVQNASASDSVRLEARKMLASLQILRADILDTVANSDLIKSLREIKVDLSDKFKLILSGIERLIENYISNPDELSLGQVRFLLKFSIDLHCLRALPLSATPSGKSKKEFSPRQLTALLDRPLVENLGEVNIKPAILFESLRAEHTNLKLGWPIQPDLTWWFQHIRDELKNYDGFAVQNRVAIGMGFQEPNPIAEAARSYLHMERLDLPSAPLRVGDIVRYITLQLDKAAHSLHDWQKLFEHDMRPPL